MSDSALRCGLRLPGAALLACLVAAVAACATSPADPYAADIKVAQQKATSDFEKAALADGKLTEQEYEEAHQRWLACMNAAYPAGSKVTVKLLREANGLYSSKADWNAAELPDGPGAQYDDTAQRCAVGTTVIVGTLYADMALNPANRPFNALVIACFKREGLVPASYSEQNLQADKAKAAVAVMVPGPDGKMTPTPPRAYDKSKVTDLDMSAQAVQDCFADPGAA